MITENITDKELSFYSAAAEITRAVLTPQKGCIYGHAKDQLSALNLLKHHLVELDERSQGLSEAQIDKAISWLAFFYDAKGTPKIRKIVSIINKDCTPK